MKTFFCSLLIAFVFFARSAEAKQYVLLSPDGGIRLSISLDERIRFSVTQDEKVIIREAGPMLKLESGLQPGLNPRLSSESRESRNGLLKPAVPVKSALVIDRYNELLLEFRDSYALRFRAYDNGIAYRFETGFRDGIVVEDEAMGLEFGDDFTAYYPEETSLVSHYERSYQLKKISDILALSRRLELRH